MKKNIIVLFMVVLSALSFSKSYIDDSKFIIEKNKIKITVESSENDMLYITAVKIGSKVKEIPFYITKEKNKIKIEQEKTGVKIGKFNIREEDNGYSVWSGAEKMYDSSFEVENEGIKERKKCFESEMFFGIGEAADKIKLNGEEYILRQESKYGDSAKLHIPFYFTSGGDTFYYNGNTDDSFGFYDNQESETVNSTEKNFITYYYWNEKNTKKNIEKFYEFSNSNSLLPKWAFGYIQSKYGYKSQKEVEELIVKFKEKKIPVSAVVLDLQWFNKMGDLDWDKSNWPNPEKMDKFLEDNGVKLITISEPFFTCDSQNYKEYDENGLFAKDSDGKTVTWSDWWCFNSYYGAIMNPIAEKAKEIAGAKYKKMADMGIDGFWTDLGEPEKTPDICNFSGYSEKEFHNYYNREWSKLVYESVREKYPDRRSFILSRSGFTGSAKYGVSVWSGDSTSSFDSLRRQVVMGLNAGMTGFSYWGSDVGGFETNQRKPNEELFVRWMQFGAFTPVFRAHGAMSEREPWIYKGKSEEIITKYINRRYELMPYIYSTAYQTYLNGTPMMRVLFSEYPEDTSIKYSEKEYFFGDYILVAPVTSRGIKKMKIYFPDTFYDINTFEKMEKGEKEVNVTIEDIPLYLKKGTILPTEKDGKNIVTIIPDEKDSSFTIYDDDGISNQFEKGKYDKVEISADSTGIKIVSNGVSKKFILKVLKDGLIFNNRDKWKENGKFMEMEIEAEKDEKTVKF